MEEKSFVLGENFGWVILSLFMFGLGLFIGSYYEERTNNLSPRNRCEAAYKERALFHGGECYQRMEMP